MIVRRSRKYDAKATEGAGGVGHAVVGEAHEIANNTRRIRLNS
jgi:hypothetical protein